MGAILDMTSAEIRSIRHRRWAEETLFVHCEAIADADGRARITFLGDAAFKIGRLVGVGWLDAPTVRASLFQAAHTCGLVDDDGEAAIRATIESGLRAGTVKQHVGLDAPAA